MIQFHKMPTPNICSVPEAKTQKQKQEAISWSDTTRIALCACGIAILLVSTFLERFFKPMKICDGNYAQVEGENMPHRGHDIRFKNKKVIFWYFFGN